MKVGGAKAPPTFMFATKDPHDFSLPAHAMSLGSIRLSSTLLCVATPIHARHAKGTPQAA
jgi:hypothetical protein